MQTRSIFLTLSALFSSLIITSISGQTVAVGHVSAEVVEFVSASSSASTDLNLSILNPQTGSANNNPSLILDNIKLGSISITAAQNVACCMTVKPATLTDGNGNDFSIEPLAISANSNDSNRIVGSQTIELSGLARLNTDQASGLYHGSYTLVFAYN